MASTPGQAGEAVQAAVARRIVLQHADHRERGQVHDAVAQDVEQDRLDAVLLRLRRRGRAEGSQPGQDVAGVRDARISQHPLHVGLRQGDDVADGHGQHGQDGDDRHPVRALQSQALGEETDQQGEGAELGPDRQEAGDRCRRSLVGVWRPVVERYGRRLEGGAHRQQRDRRQRRRQQVAGLAQRRSDLADARRPGQAVGPADAEQQDRRREAAEQGIRPASWR